VGFRAFTLVLVAAGILILKVACVFGKRGPIGRHAESRGRRLIKMFLVKKFGIIIVEVVGGVMPCGLGKVGLFNLVSLAPLDFASF
jgi:hypothetical protein